MAVTNSPSKPCPYRLTCLEYSGHGLFNEKVGVVKNNIWPYRLTVRTRPFQGCNRSSILRRVTDFNERSEYNFINPS